MSTNSQFKLPSLLVSHIKSFLEAYHNELKNSKKKSTSSSSSNSFSSYFDSSNFADPTTANALNTSTVVILRKKKSSSLKNSPFDGVRLSNYRLQAQDVQREVFEWVSHFLWLKNCPLELATLISSHVANRMSEETAWKLEESSPKSELIPALASPEFEPGIELPPMSPTQSSPSGSLPSALCSMDVARGSREMMDNYIEELGTNLDQTVHMVEDYVNSPNSPSTPTGPKGFTSSVFAIKNGRKTMEDRHIMIHDLNKALNLQTNKQYSYYAIFDGHAGIDAASYSTAHLHYNLVATEAFSQGRIEDAFREAFEVTDSKYIKRCKEEGIDQLKPSGTTALCALIEDNKTVYMAWVGDSQAVLVRNGCHEEVMLPHKPDLDSERIRIQELGGLVVFVDTWRVNGILSVTRAIGDPDHKPFVIAEPSFSQFEIDPSLDFLVLGCDGLFDQLTGQDIASHVFEFLCKNENRDPQEVIYDVSSYLSQMAIREGSSDNITSIVLFFKPFEQLVATGFPNSESEIMAESANEVESVPSASLPTTNGGHFPYTDFSELPLGANFNLHAMSEVSDNFDHLEQPIEQNNVEENLATNENLLEGYLTTASTEPAVTDLPTEWSYHEKPLTLDTPISVPQPELDADDAKPSEQQSESPMLLSESNVHIDCTTTQSQVYDTQPSSAFNPFVMEVNGHGTEEHFVVDQVTDHDATNDNAIMEQQLKTDEKCVLPTEPAPAKNPFDDFTEPLVDSSTLNLADQNVTSALLSTNDTNENNDFEQLIQSDELTQVHEKEGLPEEDVPDIVQHASDSGFCYTNSISEFSTSFPSENKIEDNFCSTPVQIEQLVEQIDQAESGLIENQSSFLQPTLSDNQVLIDHSVANVGNAEIDVDQSNNWETSLQNNSLLIDSSVQSKESTISDFAQEVQNESEHDQFIEGHANIENEFIEKETHQHTAQVEESLFEQQPSNTISETIFENIDHTTQQSQSELIDVKFANAEPIIESSNLIPLEQDQPNKIEESFQEEISQTVSEVETSPVVDLMNEFVGEMNGQLDANEQDPLVSSSEQTGLLLPTAEEVAIPTEISSLIQEVTVPLNDIVPQEPEVVSEIDIIPHEQSIGSIESKQNDVPQQLVADLLPTSEKVIPLETESKIEIEPEQKKDDKHLSKPKVASIPGTKKPLASTLIAKTRTATTSKAASTLPKPTTSKPAITKTATKLSTTTSTTARTVPTKMAPKPTLTKPTSTIPKPPISTLKARTSPVVSKANGTVASRVPSTYKPLSSTAAAKTTTRPTASASAPRVASTVKSTIPKPSTTRPLTSHNTATQVKPTESKPTVRKSLPASLKPSVPGTAKSTQSTLSRPNPTRSSPLSAPASRPRTTTSVPSKVASVRPAAAKPLTKATPSIPSKSAASNKPVNGVPITSGIKAVKKPAVASPKVAESSLSTQQNGTAKSIPAYSNKRQIGVENSLKQELEDAVNGLNGGSLPSAINPEEIVNGVNGHNGQ